KHGDRRWSSPVAIARDPFHSLGNPVVWQAPDGLIWLFYVSRYGTHWSDSRIAAKVSRDGAKTWSDSFTVAFDAGMMVRAHPIVLRNGDYLLRFTTKSDATRSRWMPTALRFFSDSIPRPN